MKFLKALDRVVGVVAAVSNVPVLFLGFAVEGRLYNKESPVAGRALRFIGTWNDLLMHSVLKTHEHGLLGAMVYEGSDKDHMRLSGEWNYMLAEVLKDTRFEDVGTLLASISKMYEDNPEFYSEVRKNTLLKVERFIA